MANGTKEKKLSLRNYIGYMLCDAGNSLGFAAISQYLSSFYTDIVKLSGFQSTLIMIIARIWDGINDPIMGFIANSAKPTKYGKYRHFIIFAGIPYAISSVLVFTPANISSTALKFLWCIFTYILCGMLYTVVLVPYGSLSSVMTRDSIERSNLSVARSIGGGIGAAPCSILFPLLIFTNQQLDRGKILITLSVIAVIMSVMYLIGFLNVKENIPAAQQTEKTDFRKVLPELLKSRPFVLISIIGCLLIATSMYLTSSSVYLFKDTYQKTGIIMTIYSIISYAPMVMMIPFTSVIIRKIGKKEFATYSIIVSVLASFITCIWRIQNPWIYMIFSALINFGTGFITVEVWALACDAIDIQELKTHRREESVTYAAFTFMRKIGQAVAAAVPSLMGLIGYDKNAIGNQTAAVREGIYKVSTIGPTVMLVLLLICFIAYPYTKDKMEALHKELTALRETMDEKQEVKA
ncbi:MAG: glycoside-pentoside-hexuronide (GPH):cation symporter [Clostridia bacterium]|nr:glycoside-pentoside-hexuronide (GPH):cation symporter [Clostridia bacterium]